MFQYTHQALADKILKNGWSIGKMTYGVPDVRASGRENTLTIGDYCSIAGNVTIWLGSNHRTDWVTTYPFSKLAPAAQHIRGHPASRGPVVIKNDVWIGNGVTILSGVTIGNGACIGARALVSSDVPDYAIVAGNPGRIIRKRFTDLQIERLLKAQWWNWPAELIEKSYPLLLQPDIDKFLDYAEALDVSPA